MDVVQHRACEIGNDNFIVELTPVVERVVSGWAQKHCGTHRRRAADRPTYRRPCRDREQFVCADDFHQLQKYGRS